MKRVWTPKFWFAAFLFTEILTLFFITNAVIAVLAPPWPAFLLRDIDTRKIRYPRVLEEKFPQALCQYNSWGIRDRERQVAKPAGVFRILFIGDSFLEGEFRPEPLSLACENRLHGKTKPAECVNLGVSSTGPIEYLQRFQAVGSHLEPDAVFLFFFSGNDFLRPSESYDVYRRHLRWIDSAKKPSRLGAILPRWAWAFGNENWKRWIDGLVVKWFRKSPTENELDFLYGLSQEDPETGIPKLTRFMKQCYFPQYSLEEIAPVLDKMKLGFWAELKYRQEDPEFLQGWIVSNLIDWELRVKSPVRANRDVPEDQVGPSVEATLSWIEALDARCRSRHLPLKVFMIPIASMDPDFRKIWQTWPSVYAFNYQQDERHNRLARALAEKGISVIDLKEIFQEVPGAYRKTDQHWTGKGQDLATDRVCREIEKLANSKTIR